MSKPFRPAERSISFGFEDVVVDNPNWKHYGTQLQRIHANAAAISVGRTDWTAFPWDGHMDQTASQVTRTGRDYVAEAITALRPLLEGAGELTLTIDTLAPRLLARAPENAGVNPQGERSVDFPSVSALESGAAGDLIVELTATICSRYAPERISLTELMFDDYTFGSDDLRSFQDHAGATDWPRTEAGGIDTKATSLGVWRSNALSTLLARVRAAAAAHGAKLDMDVRAPWSDPNSDRALSGHAYETLLINADRLVVWNYFAISGSTPQYGARMAASLESRFPGKIVMSTGLWAETGTITAEQLRLSLEALEGATTEAVSVTPASMMTDSHWNVLADLWAQ